MGRVGSVKTSQVEGMNFSALEFSDLVSDIASPTAFTGALQSDQLFRGIHSLTDPSGWSQRGNRGAED